LDQSKGEAALHQHPQFAWHSRRFDPAFMNGLAGAWGQANGPDARPAQVFWHVTEADGSPLRSAEGAGPSASAAALRALWHVRRDLHLDDDVFVLAACGHGDQTIHDVAGLAAKIRAIQQHRDSLKQKAPPTIVLAAKATSRLPEDDTAVARAAAWAEVKAVSTMDEVNAVRSCTASAVMAFMDHLASKLDETPWTRDGKPIRLSEVHVPSQVWKQEYFFRGDAFSREMRRRLAAILGEKYNPSADEDQKRKIRVPWTTEFQRPQHEPFMIVGGPGFGKTSLLRWTAREMVLESLTALHARTKTWSEVNWPVITDLAAWLSKAGDSHNALRDTALDFAALPKTHPELQRKALLLATETRLITQTEHTHLFLDALDQVPASRLRLLRERLGDLGHIAPRLVFSTREAALTTHLPFMSFSRLTKLEAAGLSADDARALAAKWLDAKLATRLEAHLRSQPAMAVVADSPLLLTLACGIVGRNPTAALPETAAHLYRDLMQSLARGEWRDTGTDAAPEPDALLARLRVMAWRLFSREAGTNRFSRDTLIRGLSGGSGSPSEQAEAALKQLCHLGFLEGSAQGQDEPQYQFRHTTFLEFLAASYLADEINAEGWTQAKAMHWHTKDGWRPHNISEVLDANAFEPAWEPVFTFTAGLMQQPRALLEMLADSSKDDIYRHRLYLFCRCYGAVAPNKEPHLQDLLDGVLPVIERMGRVARRRHPDRWKGWLNAVAHLFNLPRSGSQATRFLTQPDDHERGMMMGHHELLAILSRAAQNMHCNAGLEALLLISESNVDHRELEDAAAKAVELAEHCGSPQAVKRLEAAMDAAAEKPYRQAKLARALLHTADGKVAKKSFDLLVSMAQNLSVEDWCRSMAAHALVETFGTKLEAEGTAALIQFLCDVPPGVLNDEQRRSMAGDIISAARRHRSKTVFALQCLILRLAPLYAFHYEWLGASLLSWEDPVARKMGAELLLNQVANEGLEEYHRIQVAEELLEHTDAGTHAIALANLRRMAQAPIGDGRVRMIALKALLKASSPYFEEIRQLLCEYSTAEDLRPGWVVDAAEIAREYHDTVLFDSLMPRLREMLNGKFNLQPPETGWSESEGAAKLFFGTSDWDPLEKRSFARLRSPSGEARKDWFSVNVVCFGARSSDIIKLTEELLANGEWDFHPWVPLMRELAHRGWRFRISHRKFVILRHGQEEPRAGAEFGH
jgi:hypothetical protein